MSTSLYNTSIVPAKQALASLANILRKGEQQSNAANFITAALSEDMKPLSFQISSVVQLSEKMVARLTGSPVPESSMDISSFTDAHTLIEKALKALNDTDETIVNNNAQNSADIGMGPGVTVPMRLDDYARAFIMPNVYFHLVTAYAILRKEGVPLGKRDYLGSFLNPYLPQSQ
ncbi:hypothetical protein N7462_004448 [Penicillium macrosclerotiorum]|uniref:uncharacterized protein n=1 Tax=Penicillium macrosclerotiorum TaxID=303699 RepID=UPI002547DA5F|nr:uncharacterized protein N7462_004448 [Penicillium macrosclerotiorum]KAJ5690056.1 hypothetical protein N7462_004448 [Penicillium macrosclerotiorum]